MDNQDNIENLFKSLDHYSEEPSEKVWERLEGTLAEKKRRGLFWLFTDASIIVGLVLLGLFGSGIKGSGLNARHTAKSNKIEFSKSPVVSDNATGAEVIPRNETGIDNASTMINDHEMTVQQANKIVNLKSDQNRDQSLMLSLTQKPTAIAKPSKIEEEAGGSSTRPLVISPVVFKPLYGLNYSLFNLTPLNDVKTHHSLRPFDIAPRFKMNYAVYAEAFAGRFTFKQSQNFENPMSNYGFGIGLLRKYNINRTITLFAGLGFQHQVIKGVYQYNKPVEESKAILVITPSNQVVNYAYKDTVVYQRAEVVSITKNALKIPIGVQFKLNQWSVTPQLNTMLNAQYYIPAGSNVNASGPVFEKVKWSPELNYQLNIGRDFWVFDNKLEVGMFINYSDFKNISQKTLGIRTALSF